MPHGLSIQQALPAIANALPGMIAYWDKDLLCCFANEAYLHWFGKDPDTLIGKSMVSLLGASLFAANEPYIRGALRGERQNFERVLTRMDGTVGYTWANYIPDISATGAVNGFCVLVTDITPIKEAEAKLRESEERYRMLAENSGDMVFQLDRELVLRYVSPGSCRLLGYDPSELVGVKAFGRTHPDDGTLAVETARSVLAGEVEALTLITRMRHRDGYWVWLENLARALRDPETGEVLGIVAVLRDVSERKAMEEKLAEAHHRLEIMATHDALTKLANRRSFDETFAVEYRRAQREGMPLALIMIDVDRFKTFNDRYGHPAGDECLRQVAQAISANIRRPGDLAARYGGEEFIVLLPNTHEAGAAEIAERIRLCVRELKLAHQSEADGVVTVSAGVSALPSDGPRPEPETLLKDADRALYKAKNAGRDQVCNASWLAPRSVPHDFPRTPARRS